VIQNLLIKTAAALGNLDPGTNDTNSDLTTFLTDKVVPVIGMVAGGIAFIYLIYSGILYLTAAGNPDAAKKGQQGIINAIIGIVIIIAAWTIIAVVRNSVANVAQ
jgi:hypothetical protein